jgi:hypothetical protein
MRTQRGLVAAAVLAVVLSACSKSEAKPAAQAAKAAPTTEATPTTAAAPTTSAPPAVQPQSAPESFTDPDDVNLPLDLKTLTHSNDASTITYTVETYEAFRDDQIDFFWSLDTDNDTKIDRLVGVEYEDGKVDAKVETPSEKEIAPATVTRIGPASLKVTFPRRYAGSGPSYQYRVTSATDLNHNDEEDAGETDVAPDTGLYTHRL